MGVCKKMFAGCSADYLKLCVCADVFPLVFGLVTPYDDALFGVWFPQPIFAVFRVVDYKIFLA